MVRRGTWAIFIQIHTLNSVNIQEHVASIFHVLYSLNTYHWDSRERVENFSLDTHTHWVEVKASKQDWMKWSWKKKNSRTFKLSYLLLVSVMCDRTLRWFFSVCCHEPKKKREKICISWKSKRCLSECMCWVNKICYHIYLSWWRWKVKKILMLILNVATL